MVYAKAVVVIVSVVVSTVFASDTARALEASYWPTNSSNYAVTQIPENKVQNGTCSTQTITVTKKTTQPTEQLVACITHTKYAEIAQVGSTTYVQPYHVGNYIRLHVPTDWIIQPVPDSNRLLFFARIGYPGYYVNYVDNPLQNATVYDGYYDRYMTLGSYGKPIENAGPNDFLVVAPGAGISRNGEWMVVKKGDKTGYMRININTLEKKMFERGVGSVYSMVSMVMGETGRYVVLQGSDFNEVRVYDLETCVGSTVSNLTQLQSCAYVNLTSVVSKQISFVTRGHSAQFFDNDKELRFIAENYNGSNRTSVAVRNSSVARLEYIALGDSYSSGEGDLENVTRYLPGTDGSDLFPNEKCHVSNRAYPDLLAANLSYKTFACSGSVIGDVMELPNYANNDNYSFYSGRFQQLRHKSKDEIISILNQAVNNDTPGRVGQYRFIEKYKPKSITMTIGGNDIGFGEILGACANLLNTCSFVTIDRAGKALDIHNQYNKLRRAYRKILGSSQADTKLYVLSYPQFIDDDIQCNPNVPLGEDERTMIRQGVSYLNQVIRQAALAEGASFINIEDSLKGKGLCSKDLLGLAVNGLVKGGEIAGIFGQESFHPNHRGHQMIADYIKQRYGIFPNLTGETCPIASCADYRAPALPDYFGVTPTTLQRYKAALVAYADDTYKSIVERGKQITLRFRAGVAGAIGQLSLHSQPVELGELKADSEGVYTATVTIPDDFETGYHEIHLIAPTVSGTKVDYYEPILVVASQQDYDGDGVLNKDEQCGFVNALNVDSDHDSIDDACDGDITQYIPPVVDTSNTTGNASTNESVTTPSADSQPTTPGNQQQTTTQPASTTQPSEIVPNKQQQSIVVTSDATTTPQVTNKSVTLIDHSSSIYDIPLMPYGYDITENILGSQTQTITQTITPQIVNIKTQKPAAALHLTSAQPRAQNSSNTWLFAGLLLPVFLYGAYYLCRR